MNWIMDQYTDYVIRELSVSFKFKGKDELRLHWEYLFESVDNINVETIDFVTSDFPLKNWLFTGGGKRMLL